MARGTELISKIIMGILFMTIIIVGMSLFYTSVGDEYGYTPDDNITNELNLSDYKNSRINQLSNSIETSTQSNKIESGTVADVPFTIASGAFEGVMLTMESVDIMQHMLASLGSMVGLPVAWVVNILQAMAAIAILFAIMFIFLKG